MSRPTMRGVKLLTEDERSFLFLSRECAKPGKPAHGNVRVSVSYAGVCCGTDLLIGKGKFDAADEVIVGHEFCGIVDAVGEGVTSLQRGDKVVINPQGNCNTCEYCKRGKPNYCDNGGLRSTIGMHRDGGWADFCEVPAQQTFKVPEGMPAKTAVLCEPLSCVLNGYNRMGVIPHDSRILIIGGGYVGILWAILFDFFGYRHVTISESSKCRKDLAESLFGSNYKIIGSLSEDDSDQKAKSAEKDGYDIAVECTGIPSTIVQAFKMMKRGGKINIYGCHPREQAIEGFVPADIMFKELTIIGTLINPYTMPEAISLIQDMSKDENSKLMSLYDRPAKNGIEVKPLDKYEEGLNELGSGNMVKVVFEVHGEWSERCTEPSP